MHPASGMGVFLFAVNPFQFVEIEQQDDDEDDESEFQNHESP